MSATAIWMIEKITNFFLPWGLVPMIYCTCVHPELMLLWIVLGAAGFVFGLKTWKLHMSRRDWWAMSRMARLDRKVRNGFGRLLGFCSTGAIIGLIIILL